MECEMEDAVTADDVGAVVDTVESQTPLLHPQQPTAPRKQVVTTGAKFGDRVLDGERLLRETPDAESLSVTLKRTRRKGIGIYVTKPIAKGAVIAYYRVRVYRDCDHESATGGVYSFTVYTCDGNTSKTLVADLDDTISAPDPVGGVPFWGHFSNEPHGKHQRVNCYIDVDLAATYGATRKRLRVGEVLTYKLVALKNLRVGREVVWYYGDQYGREYAVKRED